MTNLSVTMDFKSITINHPLRSINYLTKDIGFPSNLEEQALLNYRKAHDQAWFMKIRFEQERGNALLESIALSDLDAEIAELVAMLDWYSGTGALSKELPLAEVDIKLQIELRDYYLKKCAAKPKMVALGAVMHKVCNIVFAILRDEKEFQIITPEEHQRNYLKARCDIAA